MKLDDLVGAPYNPRRISPEAAAGLAKSIERFGLVQPIIWNKQTGHVVGGHQRVNALRALGHTEAEVVVVDLPEKEEKALNVALNNRGIEGEWNESTAALLEEIKAGDPELFASLRLDSIEDELAALNKWKPQPVDEDDVPEPPEVPISQRGDLWMLGRHRLVCGDSTNATDVALAMGEIKPFIMVTDPPYGVEYDPEWRKEIGLNDSNRMGKVQNDDRVDWTPAYALFPGCVAYVWHAGRFTADLVVNLRDAGYEIRSQIIWRKQALVISRGHYHWQHEPCWYAVRKGTSAKWCGDRTQSTIWDIARKDATTEKATVHGTQKPVECMARPIRNHGDKNDAVYDPFLGSGTTLIAAEQLGRTCVGLELDPKYVDVICLRFEQLTGIKAVRVPADPSLLEPRQDPPGDRSTPIV